MKRRDTQMDGRGPIWPSPRIRATGLGDNEAQGSGCQGCPKDTQSFPPPSRSTHSAEVPTRPRQHVLPTVYWARPATPPPTQEMTERKASVASSEVHLADSPKHQRQHTCPDLTELGHPAKPRRVVQQREGEVLGGALADDLPTTGPPFPVKHTIGKHYSGILPETSWQNWSRTLRPQRV